jgi:pimeloyl-ACP methyl ester carboxylesterase
LGFSVCSGLSPVFPYPQWHEYFRKHQPPTLIAWGKNDQIFPADGAHPYKNDLKDIDFHLLDTGHFALEEDHEFIAELISNFLRRIRSMQAQGVA